MNVSKFMGVLRDLVMIGVGAFGLVHSQWTGHTNPVLVVAYLSLLGVPGAINILELIKHSSESKKESPPSP